MTVIKTQFAGKNPFRPASGKTDIDSIRITTDKPKVRRDNIAKYDHLFKQLEVGKTLACRSEDTDRLGQALRGYVKRLGLAWRVKTMTYYTKTTGRVFVLAKESK